MASIAKLALLAAASAQVDQSCDFKVQIVQVQDATSTFAKELESLQREGLVSKLMKQLQNTYGKVEYGLTTFKDKPGHVTGFDMTYGWWKGYQYHEDYCYKTEQPLTADPVTANDSFSRIIAAGGKDLMENQWDALHRTAIDPSLNWDLRDKDDTGSSIVRIAVLVTDDGAHTSPETFADHYRNTNRDYYPPGKADGPFKSWSEKGSSTQRCDLDANVEMQSNINSNTGAVGDTAGYYGSCYGWTMPKAGTLRSLKGSRGWFSFQYGFGESQQSSFNSEVNGVDAEANKYESFRACCSKWGVEKTNWCEPGSDNASVFPDINACQAYGGKYARCHPTLGTWSCSTAGDHWNEYAEPSASFWQGMSDDGFEGSDAQGHFVEKTRSIQPYPYLSESFPEDCFFEYPDPKSAEYAEAFKGEFPIIPIVIAAPPTNSVLINSSLDASGKQTGVLGNYHPEALRWSAENCPGLEFDPWTMFTCSNNEWECYTPAGYPMFYTDQSKWQYPGAYNECADDSCGASWWSECLNVEFGQPIQAINDHGATAYFKEMNAEYSAQIIIDSILDAVNIALQDKGCTTPDPTIPTTTTTTTTEATTTTATTTTTTTEETTTVPTDIKTIGPGHLIKTVTRPEEVETTTPEVVVPPIIPTDPTETSSTEATEAVETTTTEAAETTTTTEATEAAETTTTTEVTEAAETTTTTVAPGVPSEDPATPTEGPEEDNSTAIIVGSAIGGVVAAGGAVVAGLMAKGIIPMGSSGASMAPVEDVMVNDVGIEREQAAEIHGDMFA